MSRTARYKAVYFAILGIGCLIWAGAIAYFHLSYAAFGLIALVLLIPGRILGFFWRDLLRGLRLLNAGDYAASRACSERFLVYYARQPWIRHLIWLGTSSYSRDPRALALNNLGAAEFELGEIDAARHYLHLSIEADPLNPLPFFNLAKIAQAGNDAAEAERCLAEARRLGFTQGGADRVVRAAQSRFAVTDGFGR